MKTLRILPVTDGCEPLAANLQGQYIDGPIVSAILDLSRWRAYPAWQREVTHEHGKGWAYSMRRATKAGLVANRCEIANWVVDRVAIDLSMPIRQGREMSASYRQTVADRGGEPAEWRDNAPLACPRHWRLVLGCFAPAPKRIVAGREVDMKLVAYLSLVRTDNLLIQSSLLGHKAFLADGCMVALQTYLMAMLLTPEEERVPAIRGLDAVLYGAATDGSPGLRHWKSRAAFEEAKLVSA